MEGTPWELLKVSDSRSVSETLGTYDRQPFWLLDHDPLWQSALLGEDNKSVIFARKDGMCRISLLVHDTTLALTLGELSLGSIPIRRHVLTGGIPEDAISPGELAEMLVGLAERIGDAGVIFLQGVHDAEPLRAIVDASRLRQAYFVLQCGRQYQRSRIALQGDFDTYLASLRKSARKDLTRTLRRFERRCSGQPVLEVVTDPPGLEKALPDVIALSGKTHHGRVQGLGPATGNYVVRQMRFGAEHGMLRLDLLRVGGRLISFQTAYLYRDTLYTTHAGYDPEWSACAPGIAHLLLIIGDLCRSRPDVRFVDFMYGDSLYKRRLGNTFHGESQFYLFPKSARGFTTWLALGGIDRVSRSARVLLERLNLTSVYRRSVRRDEHARSRRRRCEVIHTGPPDYEGWIAMTDAYSAAKLVCCGLSALLPQRLWPRVARLLATIHRSLKGSRSASIADSCRCYLHADARAVELAFITAEYEGGMGALRELLPGGWKLPIVVRGSSIIDAALRAGRGAVLWASGFDHSTLVGRKGLALAGYPLTLLSHFGHPFSATRIGSTVLNPPRLWVENRYLEKRVLVRYGSSGLALELLRRTLRENKVVYVTAIAAGRKRGEAAFLGGTLSLALGAPRLARETGAALIPVFTVPDRAGGYIVHCGPDLNPAHGPGLEPSAAVAQYAGLLEPHVRAHPGHWLEWFSGTWRPASER